MGLPLKSYLTQILVQRARELIGSTDISIQQVAYELGYDDPYYFSRAFKKHIGWGPPNDTARQSEQGCTSLQRPEARSVDGDG